MRPTNTLCRCWWRRKVAALGLCFLALAAPCFAWNDEGHMAVAYLAYQRLQPKTRARVNALLKRNPYYAQWRAAIPANTTESEADRFIFMIAATWPDQIRGDREYVDDGPNHGNSPPPRPEASQNIGYADHFRHKYWHFIDIPYTQDGTKLPPVPSPNAETQIKSFRQTIRTKASDDVKSYDLAWLEHLVGDLHQPLHAINRVSANLPDGDAGGGLALLCSEPCGNSLHSFWDRLVGSQSGIEAPREQSDLAAELRAAIGAAQALPAPDPNLAPLASEHAWAQESYDAAKQYVYVVPVGAGTGPFTLTPSYYAAAKRIAEARVALAGVRLANLLNQELK